MLPKTASDLQDAVNSDCGGPQLHIEVELVDSMFDMKLKVLMYRQAALSSNHICLHCSATMESAMRLCGEFTMRRGAGGGAGGGAAGGAAGGGEDEEHPNKRPRLLV